MGKQPWSRAEVTVKYHFLPCLRVCVEWLKKTSASNFLSTASRYPVHLFSFFQFSPREPFSPFTLFSSLSFILFTLLNLLPFSILLLFSLSPFLRVFEVSLLPYLMCLSSFSCQTCFFFFFLSFVFHYPVFFFLQNREGKWVSGYGLLRVCSSWTNGTTYVCLASPVTHTTVA